MTEASGLGALLVGVLIDDWAFEPCGYSMNGLRGSFYYTVHVTPEPAFSFASFETNDPRFRDPFYVKRIVDVFAPTLVVATLTTRRIGCELPAYSLHSFDRSCVEVKQLGHSASVCALNFSRITEKAAIVHSAPVNRLLCLEPRVLAQQECGVAGSKGQKRACASATSELVAAA